MSFSGDVKNELCRQSDGARHCRIAELTAMLMYSDTLKQKSAGQPETDSEQSGGIVFETEQEQIAEKYMQLLRQLFRSTPVMETGKSRRGRTVCRVLTEDPAEAERIRETAYGALIQKDCCRRAFLRGAFLVSGSISDPDRSYHGEIVCSTGEQAEYLVRIFEELHIRARTIRRKQNIIVYVKESSDLSDILGLMGARVALMNFENTRILKEMRENVNRKVNCETANISKTVNAAVRQIEDIRLIEKTTGFAGLPNGLDEIAQIRLQYPEATLQELGKMLNPQVGKSGVNHRLRKLGKIAETIRGNQGGEREW